MKVKFMTKKERQQLKVAKEKNNHVEKRENLNGKFNTVEGNNLYSTDPIKIERNSDSPMSSQSSSQRERSRQKNSLNCQLTKQQKLQREVLKRKYLGLQKPQLNRRMKHNYKQRLLFQWQKQDDTSGGIMNQLSKNYLKQIEGKYNQSKENIKEKTWQEKNIDQMTDRDWRIFREDMDIFIKGGRVAYPFRQWNEFTQFSPQLLKNIQKLNYKTPKPIQMQAIPIGFQGKDMVGVAPTGQGKTLAFLIPALHHVQSLPPINAANSQDGPYVLILVPSRQLAQQIQIQFQQIAYNGIKCLRVVGGIQLDFQALDIQKGCDVLIGTPGRIKQMTQKHYLSLNRCSWVIIDEADKMISQNLIQDIQWILDNMGHSSVLKKQIDGKIRVTHMFSATMVPQIQKLTKKYLVAPVFLTIGQIGGGKKDIQQYVYLLNETQKNDQLGRILRGLPGPIIVFVNTRQKCKKIVNIIQIKYNRSCAQYHGGKSQENRQAIIQNFRNNKFQILVATDLGGRGLDIKGISAAISYDAPKNISQFIHRAGRSGRAGVKGKAFTFLTNDDEEIFYDVRVFLERNQFKVPEQLMEHPAALIKPGVLAHVSRRKQVVYAN